MKTNQDAYSKVLHFCMFVNCLFCIMLIFQAKAKNRRIIQNFPNFLIIKTRRIMNVQQKIVEKESL